MFVDRDIIFQKAKGRYLVYSIIRNFLTLPLNNHLNQHLAVMKYTCCRIHVNPHSLNITVSMSLSATCSMLNFSPVTQKEEKDKVVQILGTENLE